MGGLRVACSRFAANQRHGSYRQWAGTTPGTVRREWSFSFFSAPGYNTTNKKCHARVLHCRRRVLDGRLVRLVCVLMHDSV